jgi:hypothetical protein
VIKDYNYFADRYLGNKQNELQELMKFIFSYDSSIIMIIYSGYTPYFNDGDLCSHTSWSPLILTSNGVIDPDDLSDSSQIVGYDDDDDDDYDDSFPDILINKFFGIELPVPMPSSILDNTSHNLIDKPLYNLICNHGLIESVYDTNFIVKIYKDKNDLIVFDYSDYEQSY